jgi:hypothetical protein
VGPRLLIGGIGGIGGRAAPALVLVAVAATYTYTLLPGIHEWGDVTKAQFLGRLLGMTHPTGYPLYILLTAPLSHLPLGTLACRINLFSATCGLAALWFLHSTLRQQGVRPSFSALTAGAFGLSQTAWSQFVIAEVYALNALLVSATAYLLVRWLHSGRPRWFVLAAGVYALSFGNHLTVVTLLPAFALATALGDFKRLLQPKVLATVGLLILLGMAQYAYLFLASSSQSLYLEYRVRALSELIDFVSGERYRRLMFPFGWEQLLTLRLPLFVRQLGRDLGPFAPLALLGLFALRRRSFQPASRTTRANLFLGLATLGQVAFWLNYDIPDIAVYAIPAALLACALLGQGLELLAQGTTKTTSPLRSLSVTGAALVCLCISAMSNRPSHGAAARFSRAMDTNLATLGERAVVVGLVDYSRRMAYVYHLYATGLSAKKQLHLSYSVTPSTVEQYLAGKGSLIDSHTRQALPPGLRLFVDDRALSAQPWGPGLVKLRRQGSLTELVLAPRPSRGR